VTDAGLGTGHVRRATPSDAPAIAALWARALPGAWSEAQVRSELEAGAGCSWVWERGASPRAFLIGRPAVEAFEVLGLVVDEAERRQGAGTALMGAALARARAAGLASLQLEVRARDPRAMAFYAAAGFVAVGRRARYYRDGEDALLLTRDLAGYG